MRVASAIVLCYYGYKRKYDDQLNVLSIAEYQNDPRALNGHRSSLTERTYWQGSVSHGSLAVNNMYFGVEVVDLIITQFLAHTDEDLNIGT